MRDVYAMYKPVVNINNIEELPLKKVSTKKQNKYMKLVDRICCLFNTAVTCFLCSIILLQSFEIIKEEDGAIKIIILLKEPEKKVHA